MKVGLRHVVWGSGALALGLFVWIAIQLWSVHPTILCMQLSFTRHAFDSVTQAWSPGQRLLVLGHFRQDLALLVAYGIFGATLALRTRYAAQAPGWVAPVMPWLLPAAALLDAIEDTVQFLALSQPEVLRPDGWYALGGSAAALKFGLLLTFSAHHWRYRT